MKLKNILPVLTGWVMAFLVSAGAVGCLITGFGLTVENRDVLWLACCISALVCSGAFRWKYGTPGVLCLGALCAAALYRQEAVGQQILQLIQRISRVYDRAYDWGYLTLTELPWDQGAADYPLGILGCVLAAIVSHTVCRGKGTLGAVAAGALPLAICLVVTNTVPRQDALFCLLLGLTLLLLTGFVRRQDVDQAGRLVRLLAVPVAVALALLFWTIPREGYVNRSEETREKILTWVESLPAKVEDTAREVAAAMPGSDDEQVNLKTLGRQSDLRYPVLDVTSDLGGTVYLREWDYDSYTGTGWTASEHRSEDFGYPGEDGGTVQIRTRSTRERLFLPYYPAESATLVGGNLENGNREREYTLQCSVLPDNWRQLVQQRAAGGWESEIAFTAVLERSSWLDSARYLTLPLETAGWAKEQLATILAGESYATAKADLIAAFVRSSAVYDRDMERMPEDREDFARWFLEESDRGYCVHFATAAVVLLRAAGIPARYVTGYVAHCAPGETVTVTADTAHAWAEYYEPQLGCWVALEATPAEGLTAQTNTADAPAQPEDVPEIQTLPQTRPTEPEPTATISVPGEPQIPQTLPMKSTVELGWLLWLLIPAAAVAQVPLRITLRRRRYRDGANEKALGCWQEIRLLAGLRREAPPRELEKLAQKAKFSQHTLTREELAQMECYISDSVELLRSQRWYKRLIWRLVFAAW